MKKEFSIYLDLMRFVAALLVVVYHSNVRLIVADQLPFSSHGHAAVIVFFVLSGYVISHMAATREAAPVDYWASRLSRFYSLTIPAVLLCPLLDSWGEALAPQFYGERTTHGLAWLRIITSLTYLNEIWTVSIMSFSNVPYWSLCYEMWYYVLFAIALFMRGKTRLWLGVAVAAMLGPKIMLLAPIWVLGVVLHRHPALERIPQWLGWTLFLASWPLYGLFQHHGLTEYGSRLLLRLIGEQWHQQMAFSKFFITDYLLALIIAANFIGFRAVAHRFAAILRPGEKIVRWLAGYTFSLYILHQPLLQFYAAVFDGDPLGWLFYAQVMLATLLSIIVIGHFTEHKRHHLRRMLIALMENGWRLRPGRLT